MNAGDNRLGPIIDIITSLARGDFQPDFPEIVDDPDLEAIVLGLQMLGEELVASRAELEGRTAELERLNDGLIRLADLGNLLASFHRGRRLPPLTFSAGVAAFPGNGETREALLRAAVALYEAKHAGRDRTIAAGIPPVGLAVA